MAPVVGVAYPRPLVEGVLLRRYKRFLVDVRLADGSEVVAHCPNPGRMTSCLPEDGVCRLLPVPDPRRKLKWTLEQTRIGDGWVGVHPGRANDVVAEALERGAIPELSGVGPVAREVRAERGSRVDFRLGGRVWVEVKQVTLHLGGGVGAFPDAVSDRALKHLDTLRGRVAAGDRAVLLFAVPRKDVDVVVPADGVDPRYGVALRAAVAAGVEAVAYRIDVRPDRLVLAESLAVRPG